MELSLINFHPVRVSNLNVIRCLQSKCFVYNLICLVVEYLFLSLRYGVAQFINSSS